jgi:hypothetical protein
MSNELFHAAVETAREEYLNDLPEIAHLLARCSAQASAGGWFVSRLRAAADNLEVLVKTHPGLPASVVSEATALITSARAVSGINISSIMALIQLIMQIISMIQNLFPAPVTPSIAPAV